MDAYFAFGEVDEISGYRATRCYLGFGGSNRYRDKQRNDVSEHITRIGHHIIRNPYLNGGPATIGNFHRWTFPSGLFIGNYSVDR
jgi:hypothetical protein